MLLTPSRKWRAISVLYVASGLTALVYETVWIRLFTLSFGSTAAAFSTVVAVYLGGLATGAALAGRISAVQETGFEDEFLKFGQRHLRILGVSFSRIKGATPLLLT